MACPYETSEQVHAEAVSFWKQRRRVQSWRAVPQRLMTVCAALLVVF